MFWFIGFFIWGSIFLKGNSYLCDQALQWLSCSTAVLLFLVHITPADMQSCNGGISGIPGIPGTHGPNGNDGAKGEKGDPGERRLHMKRINTQY